jgi:hypothetical protein
MEQIPRQEFYLSRLQERKDALEAEHAQREGDRVTAARCCIQSVSDKLPLDKQNTQSWSVHLSGGVLMVNTPTVSARKIK